MEGLYHARVVTIKNPPARIGVNRMPRSATLRHFKIPHVNSERTAHQAFLGIPTNGVLQGVGDSTAHGTEVLTHEIITCPCLPRLINPLDKQKLHIGFDGGAIGRVGPG